MRRRYGSIEKKNGRYRARPRVNGKLETIGTFDTPQEAEAALVLFSRGHAEVAPLVGMTLAEWGKKWLDARELDGVHRSVHRDRHVWKRAAGAAFASLPLVAVTTRDVREWVATQLRTPTGSTGKKPARQTVANALNLLRVCLEAACDAGHLEKNPAREVRVPRVARTSEGWTWLRTEEIAKLLGEKVDAEQRDMFAVAIYTGLRAGEIFGLEWRDVDLRAATATIRYSWKGTPTKRGEARTVHLFAPVVAALKLQQKRSGKRTHVFPDRTGQPRSKDQMPDLGAALEAAGVHRHVRFHDLRHTCASHLVSGSWGRAWTLEEVAKHLGHSSSAVTRRYAHLCPEGLARAVRETRPELHLRLLAAPKQTPRDVPRCSLPRGMAVGDEANNVAESAEEKGFEPLVRLPPRRFSKPGESVDAAQGYDEKGTLREHAVELLERLQAGSCTSGDVARLAAEVLSNPPPLVAAAQRYLGAVGTLHEGAAAVAFLGLLVEPPDAVLGPTAGEDRACERT